MESTFFDRLSFFADCNNSVCGWSWASAGFLYSSTEDFLFCSVCYVEIPTTTDQNPGDIVHRPYCFHNTLDDADMSSEDARLRTFRQWPTWAKASPSELAKRGFYYTGRSDRVNCVYCHRILPNWLETDNVWSEHKRHFPNCPRAFDIPPVARSTPETGNERLTCKICLTNEISAVFLDCGHFVSCIDCAIRIDHCPICRSIVKCAKRVYF